MPDIQTFFLIGACFFIIAALYSSAGFGGGSSYLALLSLFLSDFLAIKTVALLCNLVVVANGSYLFVKSGHFEQRRSIPLALCSVPAAFFAATIHLTEYIFFIWLGGVLALSGVLMIAQLYLDPIGRKSDPLDSLPLHASLGAATGFLSGLVGIGGGILLSPMLNLLKWDDPRKIAGAASFFILVNSVAGLAGQAAGGTFSFNVQLMLPLLIAVFLGGQLGTRLSLRILKPQQLKGLTGILVAYIGVRLVLKYTNGIDI